MSDDNPNVLYMGIDPGYTNVGVCVIESCFNVAIESSFSIKVDDVAIGEINYSLNKLHEKIKKEFTERIFTPIQKACVEKNIRPPRMLCVIEQQLKCPYAIITGLMVSVLHEVGIITQIINCNTVRRTLGIPIVVNNRVVLKKRVIQYFCCVSGKECENDHIADAFSFAVYCKYLVTSTKPELRKGMIAWTPTPTTSTKSKKPAPKRKKPVKRTKRK